MRRECKMFNKIPRETQESMQKIDLLNQQLGQAILGHSLEDVMVSLDQGADPDGIGHYPVLKGSSSYLKTPMLKMALMEKQTLIVKELLARGASLTYKNQNDSGGNPSSKSLFEFAYDAKTAQYFIEAGEDPNGVDQMGKPMIATKIGSSMGSKSEINALLTTWVKAGGNPNIIWTVTVMNVKQRQSLLEFACSIMSETAVQCLLKLGADPNVENEVGETALFALAPQLALTGFRGRPQRMISHLIEMGANPDHLNQEGEPPEHLLKRFAWNHLKEWGEIKEHALVLREKRLLKLAVPRKGNKRKLRKCL